MSVLTFTGYRPPARYDGEPWTQARIQEATSANGPWTAVELFNLSPVDADPTTPATRNFTTTLALDASTHFRIRFNDADGDEAITSAILRTAPDGAMATFDELVTRLTSPQEGGFTVAREIAAKAVNRAIKRIAIRSKAVVSELELGPGVTDQTLFTLPAPVIEIKGLMVDGDSKYARVATTQFWELSSGDRQLPIGRTGAYAPRFTTTAAKQLAITPAPAAGASIVALAAVTPADYSGSDIPALPDDAEDPIQAGAKAILYDEIDEDPNQATYNRQLADAYSEELRKRENDRVNSGVIQAQIYGVHFR